MPYAEQPTGVAGVVGWTKTAARPGRILPDGCLDLLWDGAALTVAGPDTRARWHVGPPGTAYAALRMAAGTGPALLGVPADAVRDHVVPLDSIWAAPAVRDLTEQVAAGGAAALTAWAHARRADAEPDPLGDRVLALVGAGTSVAATADRLGLSPRQLHRRCLPLFGYGPRHLARVVRLGRAVAAPGSLAEVAHACGYADQAHLSREVRDLTGTTPSRLRRELTG